jgi:hypothetical protein
MQTQTAKMIYPTETVAKMIAGKLTKHKGKHIVMKIASGFQVCPVTVCQGAVSPNNATPYPVKTPLTPASKPQVSDADTTLITLPLLKDTKAYLLVKKPDGKELWIGKSTIISWDVSMDPDQIAVDAALVTMKFATKVAKQKGLI